MLDYLVPTILLIASAAVLGRRENSYAVIVQGATEALETVRSILPSLVVLLTAVSLFRESGAAELLSRFFAPVFQLFGIPPECAVLVLTRPVSGSAALAVGTDLIRQYGPDSRIGRTVAVMLGSTETTFYTISVYFGAAGIQRTRYTVPAALIADFAGFTAAAWSVRFLFPE